MNTDRPVLGIMLMLCFCILAPVGDSIAKILSSSVPVLVLLLARFSIQAFILTPMTMRSHLTGLNWPMLVLRTALHMVGIGAMFLSLRYLPLADAIAIAFVMPFILLLLGKYLEGEEVGSRRLMACLVGFIGTLLVMQPSFVEVGWPALIPLIVAVAFALFMLVTRRLARQADPITIQCVSGYIATATLLPVLGLALKAGWINAAIQGWPTMIWVQLIGVGIIGTAAHLLMTWSLRFAPNSTLAPIQYLEIPFAVLAGWLVFQDFPNGIALTGIILILGAGLYAVWREHTLSRRAAAP